MQITIIDPVDMLFKADGIQYYISTGAGEVGETTRGDAVSESLLEEFELKEFITNNQNRWELDVE